MKINNNWSIVFSDAIFNNINKLEQFNHTLYFIIQWRFITTHFLHVTMCNNKNMIFWHACYGLCLRSTIKFNKDKREITTTSTIYLGDGQVTCLYSGDEYSKIHFLAFEHKF